MVRVLVHHLQEALQPAAAVLGALRTAERCLRFTSYHPHPYPSGMQGLNRKRHKMFTSKYLGFQPMASLKHGQPM